VATRKSFRIIKINNYKSRSKIGYKELLVVTILFLALNFFVDFSRYWFFYGIVASLVAVRSGFETVMLANTVIFLLNYILPLTEYGEIIQGATQRLNVHLGMGTMYFVSSIIGRAVSDLFSKEVELKDQKKQIEFANEKLIKANQEMDRFVYSVSHDISAPLKSIMGLINLSRIEQKSPEANPYLDKIEISARKLEDFVSEVLDHSRANRKEIQIEPILLKSKIEEIVENLRYLDKQHSIKFSIIMKNELTINADQFLLKVVLSNIISNAIKYQRYFEGHTPEVNIIATQNLEGTTLKIHDNGQGIPNENKPKIFGMFYRGTTLSSGSGLGLYIAKEAIERLHGNISFESSYGSGTTFILTIPILSEGSH
jgi:signal transduction histidine kinase